MRQPVRMILFVAILVTASASPALAENAPKVHDSGVFLRLSAGFGSASNSDEDVNLFGVGTETLELSGSGADLNFAIGGMIRPNLALHGTLWGWSIDANPKYGGQSLDLMSDMTAMLFGYGGGLTYYLAPSNFYISASVGAAELDLESGNTTSSSDLGWATQAMIGKEWWVSNRWGLGMALDVGYDSVPDKDGTTWSGWGWGLLFSATFN